MAKPFLRLLRCHYTAKPLAGACRSGEAYWVISQLALFSPNLNRKANGLALEGPSVGLYVPLLEFNQEDPIRADFLRQYSLVRLPNDPTLRQRAAEFLRKQGKEDLAREVEVRRQ